MPADTEIIQITVSTEAKRAFEQEAARLHLTPAAYLMYLMDRAKPGKDAARLDKMVNEVFGRFGPAMRKLAQ
jgi:hypothetical protein